MTERLLPLVAGNWKMNGLRSSLDEISQAAAACKGSPEIVICPPATLLLAASEICRGTGVSLGAQDCHPEASGAHTGDLSADMLADAGAQYVILGHSERRADHGETSLEVSAKSRAALKAGLRPIICVGETGAEREAGQTLSIIAAQLKDSILPEAQGLVIAYEPVWAIGTGLTPSPEDVAGIHSFIRKELDQHLKDGAAGVRILYGGSVKPDNAACWAALENVNGVLVGGASLKSAEFLRIIDVFR